MTWSGMLGLAALFVPIHAASVMGHNATTLADDVTTITGVGIATASPLLAKWSFDYRKVSNVTVNYLSIGVGSEISQMAKTVEFGVGSTMNADEARKASLIQWPLFVVGVVQIINLPGIGTRTLRLDGKVLAAIYFGKIKKWNDQAIAALNPGIALPAIDIHPVHRNDGSAMTLAFTAYLSGASTEWRSIVGAHSSVEWPTGIGVKGNEGVASVVARNVGAIGYVEFGFAKENGLVIALMANQDGKYVEPGSDTFSLCAKGNGQEVGSAMEPLSLGRGNAWAVCAVIFVFLHETAEDREKTLATLRFFDWAMSNGAASVQQLNMGVVPPEVEAKIRDLWKQRIKNQDGSPIYP